MGNPRTAANHRGPATENPTVVPAGPEVVLPLCLSLFLCRFLRPSPPATLTRRAPLFIPDSFAVFVPEVSAYRVAPVLLERALA